MERTERVNTLREQNDGAESEYLPGMRRGVEKLRNVLHYLNCLPIYFMMSLPDRTNNGYQIPQLVIEYLTENVSDFGGILYKNCASYEIKFEGVKDPVKFDKYNLAILARNDFEGHYSRYIKNILKIDKKQKIDLVDIRGKSENLIDKEFKKIGIYI